MGGLPFLQAPIPPPEGGSSWNDLVLGVLLGAFGISLVPLILALWDPDKQKRKDPPNWRQFLMFMPISIVLLTIAVIIRTT